MPRRRRVKGEPIVPHLAHPTTKPKKPKRRKLVSSTYNEIPCCSIISNFVDSLMHHFIIFTFAGNLIACYFTSYYLNQFLNDYIKTNWFDQIEMFSSSLSYLLPILCLIIGLIIHSYLYLILALFTAPHGHDINSYSVGRGRFHPYRVYKFMYTCCQLFHVLLYANSYLRRISPFLSKCKRITTDGDLNNMEYCDYSSSVLRSIISPINDRVLETIEQQQRLQRNYLSQAHYDDIIKHNPNELRSFVQTNHEEIVCLFNIHYDKYDPRQNANIFLPPSLALSLNYIAPKNGKKNGTYRGYNVNNNDNHKNGHYKRNLFTPPTPAIIFLVGGAWGSCDNTYSASVGSSFVNNKIALIYPSYKIYPKGDVQDMLNNICAIIKWVIKYHKVLNINPNHIAIVGQSSGAHLGSLAVLKGYQEKSKWLKRVRLFVGLAGPYCITDHYKWESNRGIENVSPMGRAMKGCNNFPFYSPSVIAQEILTGIRAKQMTSNNHLSVNNVNNNNNEMNEIATKLPHFCLIHTKRDYVVPTSSSIRFHKKLDRLGIGCEYIEYDKGTHYDTLFGLCDNKNVLFNRLITDISSRLFILCKKFNRNPTPSSPSITPSMSGFDEKEPDNDRNPEELKIDDHNNGNNTNDKEDQDESEYYEEELEEVVHFRPQRGHTQNTEAVNNDNDNDNENDNAPELTENISLPRANTLHVIECKTDDEEEDMKKEELVTAGGPEEWEDLSLFDFQDITADENKTDEAIEFMKSLLSDMDKALNAITACNDNTKQQIDKITPQ